MTGAAGGNNDHFSAFLSYVSGVPRLYGDFHDSFYANSCTCVPSEDSKS